MVKAKRMHLHDDEFNSQLRGLDSSWGTGMKVARYQQFDHERRLLRARTGYSKAAA
jgi:hypothetical protein